MLFPSLRNNLHRSRPHPSYRHLQGCCGVEGKRVVTTQEEVRRLRERLDESAVINHRECASLRFCIANDALSLLDRLVARQDAHDVSNDPQRKSPDLSDSHHGAGWRPINTAPMRKEVLVLLDGKDCAVAYLESNGTWADWFTGNGIGGHDAELVGKPTHWMPLPEPPRHDDHSEAGLTTGGKTETAVAVKGGVMTYWTCDACTFDANTNHETSCFGCGHERVKGGVS